MVPLRHDIILNFSLSGCQFSEDMHLLPNIAVVLRLCKVVHLMLLSYVNYAGTLHISIIFVSLLLIWNVFAMSVLVSSAIFIIYSTIMFIVSVSIVGLIQTQLFSMFTQENAFVGFHQYCCFWFFIKLSYPIGCFNSL